MTIVEAPAPARWRGTGLRVDEIPACTLLLFPLAFAMSWPQIAEVWQSGTFFDTDDAMRMVQVRDWLSGQGWFDLIAHRLDPPAGLPMHWSRVVDLPLGTLVRLFGIFIDPIHAERLARLMFPLGLQAAMIAATAWVARTLAGPGALLPATFLVVLSGISFGQFQPGRIDHHAPQILLLMLATGSTLRCLAPAGSRWAFATGGLVALSLSISLENLPFFAIILAVPAIAWAARGAGHRPTLLWFSVGLGLWLPMLFAATVPPAHYGLEACDAFSTAHLAGLLAGAAGLLALGLASPYLGRPEARWSALAIVGFAVIGFVLLAHPACLHDPYGTMDPLVERLWLRHVGEAQPLPTAIRLHPDTLTIVVCPILAGTAATLTALWVTRGTRRAAWLVVAALVGIGVLGCFWELRVASSVGPLALLSGAWVATAAFRYAERRNGIAYAALPFAAMCLFSTVAWALLPVPGNWGGESAAGATGVACRTAGSLAPLAGLPPVLAFAPTDSGSHLLAHTAMSVLAAPYHRDIQGNRLVLQGFSAVPDAARAIVAGSGAKILTFCQGDTQMKLIARETPGSLAAALLAGEVPAWLTPLPVAPTPYAVFRVE